MKVLRALAVLAALFVAYVLGRAVGILLGIGPYATEAVALAAIVAAVAWFASRRSNARSRDSGRRP